ncbi:hypothetical protein ABBQ38_002214 [Trebouxia sp. C0009 RCD-2024]
MVAGQVAVHAQPGYAVAGQAEVAEEEFALQSSAAVQPCAAAVGGAAAHIVFAVGGAAAHIVPAVEGAAARIVPAVSAGHAANEYMAAAHDAKDAGSHAPAVALGVSGEPPAAIAFAAGVKDGGG